MNGGVTAGGPAGADLEKSRVIRVADVNVAGGNIRALDLRVAAQAQVGIVFDEQFLVDGTVRIVTDGAALAEGLMLENEGPGLGLMALRAALILHRHGQSARGFKDVAAVRIVTVHATHVAFDDGMMLRQVEFALHIEMALETGFGIFAGIDDELRGAAGADVFAAGAMAGFATAFAGHGRIFKVQTRMRTGGKFPDDVGMAIGAGPVAHIMRAGNFQRHGDLGRSRGTGNQKNPHAGQKPGDDRHRECPF